MTFIESICLEKGQYQLLHLHQQRMERTFQAFFPEHTPPQLSQVLPTLPFQEKYKVRVVYDADTLDIEYAAYSARMVNGLYLLPASRLSYSYKFENRRVLENLHHKLPAFHDFIAVQNKKLTDSFYANLAFWDGRQWHTPQTYLLNGVKRQHLLACGALVESPITTENFRDFKKVSLINAMLDPGEVELSISQILSA